MFRLQLAFAVWLTIVGFVGCATVRNVCREEISTNKGKKFLVTFSTFDHITDFKGIIYIGSYRSGSVSITTRTGSSSSTGIRQISPGIHEISISSLQTLLQTSEGKQTKLIRIESTVDIAVYMAGYSSGIAGAYTVFPESTWSSKYVVASFKPEGSRKNVAIVSNLHNNTVLDIANKQLNYSINTTIQADESYAVVKNDDISGTTVTSNTPISLVSENQCANIPEKVWGCDTMIDSPIPVEYWASEFIVPPLTPRLGYLVRVFAQDHNEVVSIVLKNRTHSINQTFSGMYEILLDTDALVIMTDKKVNVVQYGLSNNYDNIDGDPFMTSVPAVQHYSNDYQIPTPFASDGFIISIAITIRQKHLSGLLFDGQLLDLQTAATIVIVQPYGDFRIVILNITSGHHRLSHPSSDAHFSVLLYGRKLRNAFGLYLGYNFHKDSKLVCENGGFCKNGSTCQCLEGYTGDACQIDIDECLNSSTCVNGATCRNTIGGFKCHCNGGLTGQHCETDIGECLNSSTCVNGATCRNTIGGFKCICTSGWTGQHCETDINECLNSSTCLPGTTCFNNLGSFKCLYSCPEAWTDKPCKTASENKTEEMVCFSCEDLSDLSHCEALERCHDNQICFMERYASAEGRMHYRSGCKDRQICKQHNQMDGGRSTCLQCCENSFCNSHGCGSNGLPPRDPRGPLCLDCSHVKDSKGCDQITLCSSDESCHIEELKWGDESLFHLGCKSIHQCSFESNRRAQSSGSLSVRSIPECRSCCHDDFCNQNCTKRPQDNQQTLIG